MSRNLHPLLVKTTGEGTILDIREHYELSRTGKVKHAVHIPIGQLQMRLAEISKEKPVYVYCGSGRRAEQVVSYLINEGYNAYNTGGVSHWYTSGYELVFA